MRKIEKTKVKASKDYKILLIMGIKWTTPIKALKIKTNNDNNNL